MYKGTIAEKHELEEGLSWMPRLNGDGLIPCMTLCASTHEPLMLAWMNEMALQKTLETKEMHYWSRSRQKLWHKGAESGFTQSLVSLKIDCDQDCLCAFVTVNEPDPSQSQTCHTGRSTCFYRDVLLDDEKKIILAHNQP